MFAWAAQLRKKKAATIWAAIFLAGLAIGISRAIAFRSASLTRLADQARRLAATLNPNDLRAIGGVEGYADNPAYARVKARLVLLQSINPEARFVSVVRVFPASNKVIFIADSSPPGSAGLRPGDAYAYVSGLPARERTISTNIPSAQGPESSASGTWAMGFAIVPGEPAAAGRDILGLDVSAASWTTGAWASGFHAALYTWLVLGLPFCLILFNQGRREQRKAFRNLLGAIEQSESAVMIVDLESCIEYVNAALCAQIGFSRRELVGRPWRDFQQPETPPERLAEMVATVRAGSSWRGEWFNRRRNGDVVPVRGVISPVKNRDGSPACFVAVFEDMTELKRSEEALRAALTRAESGDRAKSQFLATMSHEVRTPLNGIIGFTSLLLGMQLTPEQDEYLQIIRSNGEALIQLTGDILDFAHIESGSLKLEPKPCSPRACVEATLELLAVQAATKRVELLHWIDENVPEAIVADEARLRQVLVNLASNAVKFTDTGEVEVTVRAEKAPAIPGNEPGWNLSFCVRDTGIGIAPEDHDKLFKPFNQVDVSATRRHGGTGLGLAISKNLVQMMDGTISVESGVGRGSRFTFSLPVTVAAVEPSPHPGIAGLRLALAAAPGPFRREFARLARRWEAPLIEVDSSARLNGCVRDVTFIEVDAGFASSLAARLASPEGAATPVGWAPDKTYAIVPITLPRDLRSALRGHFRQIINKPLRHEAVLDLLAGARPPASSEESEARFGLNVLVAEDNAINQRLVQKLLWNLGCTSMVTENGRAVLEEIEHAADQYDLVLMDLHMPEVDGLEAIQRIRSGEAGEGVKSIWIAALTADARPEQKEKVLASGGNDYIVKPIKLGELADALRRFVSAKSKR